MANRTKQYNDVEEQVIQKKLESLVYTENIPELSSLDVLKKNIEEMEQLSQLIVHGEIATNFKLLSKFVIFIKKIMRKCMRWYIEPVCIQQSSFNNASILSSISMLSVLEESIEEIRGKNEELLAQINNLKALQKEVKFVNERSIKLAECIESIREEAFNTPVENFWLSREAYAQAGEDIIIEYILMVMGINIQECKYLDLGANHAKELSNTYSLYRKGARGVLVEANPALISELKFYRHEDIIVDKCISDKDGERIPLYIINGDGLVSSNKESVDKALSINSALRLEETIEVETININTLLEKYFVRGPEILSVDIEGESLHVLKAMDWKRFRPLIVIVEMIEYSVNLNIDYKDKDIQQFMEMQGFTEYAFTGINSIYLDRSRIIVR